MLRLRKSTAAAYALTVVESVSLDTVLVAGGERHCVSFLKPVGLVGMYIQ